MVARVSGRVQGGFGGEFVRAHAAVDLARAHAAHRQTDRLTDSRDAGSVSGLGSRLGRIDPGIDAAPRQS